MQVLFTKYVVSETIQSILELLKHFKIVPVTSVIRNNNGNFGVDFLKSMPGAKKQLRHTDYINVGINSTGSSIIINFEKVPFGLNLLVDKKEIFVTVAAESFIYFNGKVEHCGIENNTEYEINKIFFFIDENENVRNQKSVFDKVFFNENNTLNTSVTQNIPVITSSIDLPFISSTNITSIPLITEVSYDASGSEQQINSNRVSKRLLNQNSTYEKPDKNIVTPGNVMTTEHTKKKKTNETQSSMSNNTTNNKVTKSITSINKINVMKNNINQLKLEHATSLEYNLNIFNSTNKKNLDKISTLKKENKAYKKEIIELNKAIEEKKFDRSLIDHLHNYLRKVKNELSEAKNELANNKQPTNNVQEHFINENEKLMADYNIIKNENINYKKKIERFKEELKELKNTIKTLDKKSNNDTSNDSTVNSEQKQVYNPDFKSEPMVKMLIARKRMEELEESCKAHKEKIELTKESDEDSDDFFINRKNIEKINNEQFEK
jgi:hypothetical protein